ncbi:hypothetical protein Aperf_G00000037108 [Anoplocephala perfoliata]
MSDTPKRIQLTLKEIDRLLADSPMPTPRDGGGLAGSSRPLPKVTITDEDLALLDETGTEGHLSPVALALQTTNAEAVEKTTPITAPRTAWITQKPQIEIPIERCAVTSEAATTGAQIQQDPTASHEEVVADLSGAGQISPPGTDSTPQLYFPSSESQQRSMLGHPITGSVVDELETQQLQPPPLSPLLTQTSKLISGMVSSLLSPWSASRQQTGQSIAEDAPGVGDEGPVEDRSCEESLINAFGRIGVGDNSSEQVDVFLSPSCELEDTVNRRVSAVRGPQNLSSTSALTGDTRYESTFVSETSHYSDATSALPSPLKLPKPSSSPPLDQSVPSAPRCGECPTSVEFRHDQSTATTTDIDLTPVEGGDVPKEETVLNDHQRISVAPSPKRRSLRLKTTSQESSQIVGSTLPVTPEKSVREQEQERPLSPLLPPSQLLEGENHERTSAGHAESIQADAQNLIKEPTYDSSQKDTEDYAKGEILGFMELPITEQPLQAVSMLDNPLTQPSSISGDSHPELFEHSTPVFCHESLSKNELLDVVQSEVVVHLSSHIETPGQIGPSVPQTFPGAESSSVSATSEGPNTEVPLKLEPSSPHALPETEFSALLGGLQEHTSEQPDLCIPREVPETENLPSCNVVTGDLQIKSEESELCSHQEFPAVHPGDLQMEVIKQSDLSISHKLSGVGVSNVSDVIPGASQTDVSELHSHQKAYVSITPDPIPEDFPLEIGEQLELYVPHGLPEVGFLTSAALSVSDRPNSFDLGISTAVAASVYPIPSEGTTLKISVPIEMAEPLVQTDSIASKEPIQEVSRNSTFVMGSCSESGSESAKVAGAPIVARISQVTEVDEQSNATMTSLSETPKSNLRTARLPPVPCMVTNQGADYRNRSQRSVNRTTSLPRRSLSNASGRRSRSSVRSTLQEEQEISARQGSEFSFRKASDFGRTIILEKASWRLSEASLSKDINLEMQPPDVPHGMKSVKPAPDNLAGAEDKENETSFNRNCQSFEGAPQELVDQASDTAESAESLQENKENVSPVAQPVIKMRRATHRVPVLSVPARPTPAPRRLVARKPSTALAVPEPESDEEEKAQLRREIEALRGKEDVLRVVLAKYRATFEEALDQLSRMHFATVSARAQADQEACGARRQAGTLYNVILESKKRHERMQASIENYKTSQEQWMARVEALKEKYARLLEKGLTYRKYCVIKIQKAVENLEATKTELDKDLSKLRVQNKQLEMKQNSLEATLEQKAKENEELTKICDNLLKGVL